MEDYYTIIKDWIVNLGQEHEVDPVIFGSLYLTSKLLFFSFLGWTVKTYREKKSIIIPLLFASVSFSIPYLYLIIAGKNISIWIYIFIALIFIYGGFTIKNKLIQKEPEASI